MIPTNDIPIKELAKKYEDKLNKIKVALFDVDGVLTDGKIFYQGSEVGFNRFFHTSDGYGLKLLKNFIEFNLKEKSSIKELRQEILKFIDNNFKGNKTYKKLVSSSVFCSEDNNIIHDDFKINKEQKIGIIPPIGGG